jgi:hypothetical protein
MGFMNHPREKPQSRFSDRRAIAKGKKLDHMVGIGNNYFRKNSATLGKTSVSDRCVQENLEKQLDICFGKSPRAAKTPGKRVFFITRDFSTTLENEKNARQSNRDRQTEERLIRMNLK